MKVDEFESKASTKGANLVDRQIGARIKLRRRILGMTQEALGEALGVTFQQVQKYEKGTNRIGASRLEMISKVLNVPPSFFFQGAGLGSSNPPAHRNDDSARVADFLSTEEGLALTRAFLKIGNAKVRKRVVDLVAELADAWSLLAADNSIPHSEFND